ncbi:MAG: hypothetical protein Fur0043_15310 [Anaerolineales bacterium]
MNGISLFILGLLIGWLAEWLIDWLYWRRKHKACQEEKARLQARLEEVEKERTALQAYSLPAEPPQAAGDDLTLITGIGPVIAGMLKDAGIDTFDKLAALPIEKLRDILGDLVERLVDEQSLLEQARNFAQEKRLTGHISNPKKKDKGERRKSRPERKIEQSG